MISSLTKKWFQYHRISHVSIVHQNQDNQAIPTFQTGATSQHSIQSDIHFLPACCHFPIGKQMWSDKHSTVRTPSPTARLNQHAVRVSPVKRRKWIQAACKLIKREGRGGRRFTSIQYEKTFLLDLTMKRKTDEGVLMLYVMEDWPIAVYNQMTSLSEY